jgi:hypothetical protein
VINPIRLANEWRDTLLAVTLVAAWAAFLPLYLVLAVALHREFARTLAWFSDFTMRLAGSTRVKVDHKAVDFATHAVSGFIGIMMAIVFAQTMASMVFSVGCFLMSVLISAARTGAHRMKPADLVEAYTTIWDWPRKRDGGGGETKKLAALVESLSGRLVPSGA